MIIWIFFKNLTFSLSPVQQTHHQKQHVRFFSHPFGVCVTSVSVRLRMSLVSVPAIFHTDVTVWLTEAADLSPRQDVHLCIFEPMKAAITMAEKVSADNTDHNIIIIDLHNMVGAGKKSPLVLQHWKVDSRKHTRVNISADICTVTGSLLLLSIQSKRQMTLCNRTKPNKLIIMHFIQFIIA